MGEVVPFRRRPGSEPWLSRRQVAAYFGFSTRWVELRVREGMPSEVIGGRRRFRASDCEEWLLKGRSA
jgi:hypothetical protein